jgi:hypothetical protein
MDPDIVACKIGVGFAHPLDFNSHHTPVDKENAIG